MNNPSQQLNEEQQKAVETAQDVAFGRGLIKYAVPKLAYQPHIRAALVELRKVPELGQNRVAIPTHVLEEFGYNWKTINRESMGLILAFVDLDNKWKDGNGDDKLIYTPGFIELDQVSMNTAFGYFIPVSTKSEEELLKVAVSKEKIITAMIDFLSVAFDQKSVSITTVLPSALKELLITETDPKSKKETERREELKGPGHYQDTAKESFDKMDDRRKREHIDWIRHLDLQSRLDRRVVREFLASGIMEEEWRSSGFSDRLTHKQFLANLVEVDIESLEEFEKMDSMDDESYIEAVRELMQTEIELLWKEAQKAGEIPEGKTFTDWVQDNYGCAFDQVHHTVLSKEFPNRFQAFEVPVSAEADEFEEHRRFTFGVQLEGGIFEEVDRPEDMGVESPFAIGTLRALLRHGHSVILMTDRSESERERYVEYMQSRGLTFTAINHQVPNDLNRGLHLSSMDIRTLGVDFLLDKRCVFAATNSLSNPKKQTLYWPQIVSRLKDINILFDEDIEEIQNSLQESYEALIKGDAEEVEQ